MTTELCNLTSIAYECSSSIMDGPLEYKMASVFSSLADPMGRRRDEIYWFMAYTTKKQS